MGNIVLTSCGIRNEDFKRRFYEVVPIENIGSMKVLYIITASEVEEGDKEWMDWEYKSILNLGIKEENITEYKIGISNINIFDFDIMYMLGGNTFYLLDVIRKNGFDKDISKFLSLDKTYIGSSAGSEILGNSIDIALGYDENIVNMSDFTGLKIIDGLIIPHCDRKEEFINKLRNERTDKLYLLYDGDGIIKKDD